MHEATQQGAPEDPQPGGHQYPDRIAGAGAHHGRDCLFNQQAEAADEAEGQVGPGPRQDGVSVKEFSSNPGRKETRHVSTWGMSSNLHAPNSIPVRASTSHAKLHVFFAPGRKR